VYDTAYAHQDKKDDVVVGIKSTALLFGDNTKAILSVFLASSALLAAWAGLENAQGVPFFFSLLVGTALLGVKLRSVE
jgi:4-hydroxybenzoate polyprenyltransferase